VKPGCETHGYEGPVNVSYGGSNFNIANDYIDTWLRYDKRIEKTDDVNDFCTVNKVGKWPKWIDPATGMRSDAAHAFIHPLTTIVEEGHKSKSLSVLLESKCVRVLFDGTKAVGVEYYNT
jgi:alcohol oxidase